MGKKTQAKPYLTIEQVKDKMKESKDTNQLQRWHIVYTSLLEPKEAKEIAISVGVSKSLVQKVISRYNREGIESILVKSSGGRYHEYLTKEEEEQFLLPFFQSAEKGEHVTVKNIHLAYEERVGYSVHETTIYRLLKRHGWRKVQPRPRHPKADIAAQEDFKKNWEPPFKKRSKIESRMIIGQCCFWYKTRLVLAELLVVADVGPQQEYVLVSHNRLLGNIFLFLRLLLLKQERWSHSFFLLQMLK
jgi:transposase